MTVAAQFDRDGIYGEVFRETALGLGIKEVLCARRSHTGRTPHAERLIGSIRRECLDHVIVFHAPGLRRVSRSYFEYYTHSRTHLSLEKDAPIPCAIQPPEFGKVVELREVGGLHHRYAACRVSVEYFTVIYAESFRHRGQAKAALSGLAAGDRSDQPRYCPAWK